METFDIYQDIATRTGGDIYLGVVGPVRTGKSTFIKRFMETFVLPNIEDVNRRTRVISTCSLFLVTTASMDEITSNIINTISNVYIILPHLF